LHVEVVNGLLLRPLPVADPHRLVTISSDAAIARGYTAGAGWTFAMWEELQPHVDLFDGTLAWTPARFDLAPSGERQLVDGLFARGGYFATLGVPAILGRTFTAADDRPGGGAEGPVAVISYGFWQRRFGGAAGVVGGPLILDGVTVTIVRRDGSGVLRRRRRTRIRLVSFETVLHDLCPAERSAYTSASGDLADILDFYVRCRLTQGS
jgi:hypothetical protein